jgi:hypothetical protein
MLESTDACMPLDKRNFKHEPNETLPKNMLLTFCEGSRGCHRCLQLEMCQWMKWTGPGLDGALSQ